VRLPVVALVLALVCRGVTYLGKWAIVLGGAAVNRKRRVHTGWVNSTLVAAGLAVRLVIRIADNQRRRMGWAGVVFRQLGAALSREASLTNLSALAETTDDPHAPPEGGEASLGVSPQLSPRAECTQSHDDESAEVVIHEDSHLRSTCLTPPSPSHAAAAAAETGTVVRELEDSGSAASDEARHGDGGDEEGTDSVAQAHDAQPAVDSTGSAGTDAGGSTDEATWQAPGATPVQPPSQGAAEDSDRHRTRAVSEAEQAASQATDGTAAPSHVTETTSAHVAPVHLVGAAVEQQAVQAATRQQAVVTQQAVQAASPEGDAGLAPSDTNPASTTVEQVGSNCPAFVPGRSRSSVRLSISIFFRRKVHTCCGVLRQGAASATVGPSPRVAAAAAVAAARRRERATFSLPYQSLVRADEAPPPSRAASLSSARPTSTPAGARRPPGGLRRTPSVPRADVYQTAPRRPHTVQVRVSSFTLLLR
jgi:hypothetical protein